MSSSLYSTMLTSGQTMAPRINCCNIAQHPTTTISIEATLAPSPQMKTATKQQQQRQQQRQQKPCSSGTSSGSNINRLNQPQGAAPRACRSYNNDINQGRRSNSKFERHSAPEKNVQKSHSDVVFFEASQCARLL